MNDFCICVVSARRLRDGKQVNPTTLLVLWGGGYPMDDDVGVPPDGRREVSVERHVESEVVEPGPKREVEGCQRGNTGNEAKKGDEEVAAKNGKPEDAKICDATWDSQRHYVEKILVDTCSQVLDTCDSGHGKRQRQNR